jgi:SAM-dependent MidA family methyltransferase
MPQTPALTIPSLDADQAAQLARVLPALAGRIAARGGWLGFDEYLEQVLYAPGLGYYSAGAAKLGPDGDFTTAPERTPLFGYGVARAIAPLLASIGNSGSGGGEVLELGAGSGALAEAVLVRLATLGVLPARYAILEVSADLRARQRARLARLPPLLAERIEWLDALPATPLRGVLLANEVADALPFRCLEKRAQGCVELGVSLSSAGAPQWAERPADAALLAELQRIESGLDAPLEPGYRTEACPRLDAWIASLAGVLDEGLLLLFDYGLGRRELYHPQRHAGTLRCHFRHRAHDDPFLYPGLQDVTAWVDFTRVAEAASDAGLEVAGYCTQAAFLLSAGLSAEIDVGVGPLDGAALRGQLARAAEARELLQPDGMGEVFKAIALVRGLAGPVPGFTMQDLRRLL